MMQSGSRWFSLKVGLVAADTMNHQDDHPFRLYSHPVFLSTAALFVLKADRRVLLAP